MLPSVTSPRAPSSPNLAPYGDLRRFVADRASVFARTPGFDDFFAAVTPGESERVGRLWQSAVALRDGMPDAAAAIAESLVRQMPDEDDGSGALAVRTFAEALLARVRGDAAGGGNLYLTARPPGAQLRAFELLRLRTPLIPFAYAAGNRALLEVVEPFAPADVTLLDLGIGRGGQVRALLRNPSARAAFASLHVIGVEPDSSASTGSGALETAEASVLEAAQEAGIAATFTPIPKLAEDLTPSDIAGAGPRGLFLASSSFALHHAVAAGGREGALRTLRDAGARAVVLVEPDSNHYDDALDVRFAFAYRHYRTLAQILHETLSPSDASLAWSEFFAPEVRNVIAHDGRLRVERHQELARWGEHLVGAGFALDGLRDLVPRSAAAAGFDVCAQGAAFSLGYRGTPVLGVLRGRA